MSIVEKTASIKLRRESQEHLEVSQKELPPIWIKGIGKPIIHLRGKSVRVDSI